MKNKIISTRLTTFLSSLIIHSAEGKPVISIEAINNLWEKGILRSITIESFPSSNPLPDLFLTRTKQLKGIYYGKDLAIIGNLQEGVVCGVLMGLDESKNEKIFGIRSIILREKSEYSNKEIWSDKSDDYLISLRKVAKRENSFLNKNSGGVLLVDLISGPTSGLRHHPVGISLVYTALRGAGIDTHMMAPFRTDENKMDTFLKAENQHIDKIIKYIKEKNIKTVGLSVYNISYSRTQKLIEALRKEFGQDIFIVGGGPMMTSLAVANYKTEKGFGPWDYCTSPR